jgi:predicted peroxiredoxin
MPRSIVLRISSTIFTLVLLLSCSTSSNNHVQIPGTVLSEEKFAKVLADFALAEGAANMNIKNVAFQTFDTVYAFNPLKENNIRKTQYDSTILFYSQHIELYKNVYENVLALLSEMQVKRDSLKVHSIAK